MQRRKDRLPTRELALPDIRPAVDFIAGRYIETGLLDPATAADVITERLSRPGRIVFTAGDPIQAAGCLVVRRNAARVTCLASVSPAAVIAIFGAVGERLLSLGVVSLRAKVHPKYSRFYSRVIGAEVSECIRPVEAVGGADGVNIRLLVDRERLAKLYSWQSRVMS